MIQANSLACRQRQTLLEITGEVLPIRLIGLLAPDRLPELLRGSGRRHLDCRRATEMPMCLKYLVRMSSILEYFLQGVLLLLVDEQEFLSEMGVEAIPLHLIAQLSDGRIDQQQFFAIA